MNSSALGALDIGPSLRVRSAGGSCWRVRGLPILGRERDTLSDGTRPELPIL